MPRDRVTLLTSFTTSPSAHQSGITSCSSFLLLLASIADFTAFLLTTSGPFRNPVLLTITNNIFSSQPHSTLCLLKVSECGTNQQPDRLNSSWTSPLGNIASMVFSHTWYSQQTALCLTSLLLTSIEMSSASSPLLPPVRGMTSQATPFQTPTTFASLTSTNNHKMHVAITRPSSLWLMTRSEWKYSLISLLFLSTRWNSGLTSKATAAASVWRSLTATTSLIWKYNQHPTPWEKPVWTSWEQAIL